MATKHITLANPQDAVRLFGQYDQNLRLLEERFHVHIWGRGQELTVRGPSPQVRKTEKAIRDLLRAVAAGPDHLSMAGQLIDSVNRQGAGASREAAIPAEERAAEGAKAGDALWVTERGRMILPKTPQQKLYVDAIQQYDIVVAIGPAGTGKTFLAVAAALRALRAGKIQRIVLTRPVVEAGERLGFLPGDLYEKVNPFLRPLYDAFYALMGSEPFHRAREEGTIDIAPLAYMRGRTLDDSFVIVDEAQNTSVEQMKMVLTRMGFRSQVVITGDVTQIDIEDKAASGLVLTEQVLDKVPGIKFVYFTEKDVIRHELVKKIILAYTAWEKRTNGARR